MGYSVVELDTEQLEKYKKQIDEDFIIFKDFLKNRRFIQLEKSWIKSLSHGVMQSKQGFTHLERVELRNKLFKYLKSRFNLKVNTKPYIFKEHRDYIKKRKNNKNV